MKNDVIRARIDSDLKAQAAEVLKANGLGMSDAIRIFLQQVVRCGGLPFAVRNRSIRVASGKRLWAMKRAAQARDRRLVASGKVPPEAMIMLRPERLKGAVIEWPEASLLDD
ncbi:MAG TPA: type II toxin-antitoxin system RelB/DinJ family antitoxin [Gammaproteobacteria bacterium]